MSLRIAVICAANRRNTGMLTVDIAADQFFQASGADITFFRSHVVSETHPTSFAGQPFVHYRDPAQLRGYDRIVFWGDFQNSLPYGRHNFSRLDARFGPPVGEDESFARWRRLFLLEGYRRTAGQRVISVSNNFQGLEDAAQDLAPEPRAQLAELYASSFDAIFPRDPQSLRDLLQFAPAAARGRVAEGLDAAFLLDPRPYRDGSASVGRLRLPYFFGRSGFERTRSLMMECAVRLRCVPRNMFEWLSLEAGSDGHAHLKRQFSRLTGARAVLTDTYHLCVNALNLEIPVVGIGRPATRQVKAAGDFKKAVLFESLGLREFYIDRPELDRSMRQSITATLAKAAPRAPVWQDAFVRLEERRSAYREQLQEAIF